MILIWLIASHLRLQRALQWWSRRQSIQLSYEAENIRDGVLQELFTVRRSLELSRVDDLENSVKSTKDWLEKIEKVYQSLEQLSNRLLPPYIEESLPLAIQYMLKRWQTNNSKLNFETELPTDWSHEPPERNRVIVMALDELLRMTLSELLTEAGIYVSLKLQGHIGVLMVQISYPDSSTVASSRNSEDLEHLSQAFQVLASGQCFRQQQDLTATWYFRWHSPKDGFQG